jgi:FMN reductase [NAD(P)H]
LGEPGGSPKASPHLPNAEPGQALRLFSRDLDRFDPSAARAAVGERDESFHGVVLPFEDGFHRPVEPVRNPSGNVMLLCEPPHRVAEEHALNLAVDDDAAPDHGAYSRAMDFKDILRQRRMVRAYEPEPVPRAAIERIVETVRRAPSAGFSQGQRLLVVTDAETRRRIAQLLDENNPMRGPAPKNDRWITASPVLIVVGVREADYHDRYRKPDKLIDGREVDWPIPYWHFDAGAAAMLILLAAIDEGYAAGVFGVFVEAMEPFKSMLAIPNDVDVACCITIGKPADDSSWSATSSRLTQARRSVDDLVRWERWSSS